MGLMRSYLPVYRSVNSVAFLPFQHIDCCADLPIFISNECNPNHNLVLCSSKCCEKIFLFLAKSLGRNSVLLRLHKHRVTHSPFL